MTRDNITIHKDRSLPRTLRPVAGVGTEHLSPSKADSATPASARACGTTVCPWPFAKQVGKPNSACGDAGRRRAFDRRRGSHCDGRHVRLRRPDTRRPRRRRRLPRPSRPRARPRSEASTASPESSPRTTLGTSNKTSPSRTSSAPPDEAVARIRWQGRRPNGDHVDREPSTSSESRTDGLSSTGAHAPEAGPVGALLAWRHPLRPPRRVACNRPPLPLRGLHESALPPAPYRRHSRQLTSTSRSRAVVRVTDPAADEGPAPAFAFSDVGAGVWHTCGVRLSGAVTCWGMRNWSRRHRQLLGSQ